MARAHSGSIPGTSSPVGGLLWPMRAKVVTGPTHRRRIRESRCGWYRVVHSRCLYGPRKGKQAIPDVWYAMKLVVVSGRTCWEIISQHRQQDPAVRACEKDSKKGRDETQACDRCGNRPPAHFEPRGLFAGKSQLCKQCWNYFRRHPHFGRALARKPGSGGRQRSRPSRGQLCFAFGHENS